VRQPARDIRPDPGENLLAHEQAEMSARRHGLLDRAPWIDQMLRRKYLLGRHDIVVACGEQEQRAAQLGKIDLAAERHETADGKAVVLE